MKNKSLVSIIIFTFIMLTFIGFVFLNYDKETKRTHKLYTVYLGGKKVGTIENDEELFALIDYEQQEIKDEYGVDKIYPPKGLEIKPIYSYKNNTISSRALYEEIKDIDPFTIEGYEVIIKKENNPITFYILNKSDLDAAVKTVISSYVNAEEYALYLEGKNEKPKDEGIVVTDVYLGDEMTIKKAYISVDDKIFTNADDITRYFLFATMETDKYYSVKEDDTIETIAEKNKMSVKELLIANPEIVGENALFSIGQQVNVAVANPLNDIVVETIEVENQVIKYETKTEYDSSIDASTPPFVKVKGSNGLVKVEFATKTVNGIIAHSVQGETAEIVAVVDEVRVIGASSINYVGSSTYWAWPTSKPYRISDHFGWRLDPFTKQPKMHTGTDITGVGTKDGIYSIQDGTVIASGYTGSMGNYVYIDHKNGYVSQYLHLSKILVKKGQSVKKGEQIGVMGNTGRSTGKHLHLSVTKDGGYINAMNLYK